MNPLLMAWKLELRSRLALRRWGVRRAAAGWGALAALGVVLFVVTALFMRGLIGGAVQSASAHLAVTGALIAALVSMFVHRARLVWSRYYSAGWLATLPVKRRAAAGTVVLRSLVWPCAGLMLLSLASLLVSPSAPLLSAVWIGGAGGAMLGWWLPNREPPALKPSIVYSVAPRASGQLTALARWPLAQAKLWMPPRAIAWLVLFPMLALPHSSEDVSGNIAIAVACAFIIGMYLLVLLRATLQVARDGARWLRPTPLSFRRFAWSVLRNPMLKQLQWTLGAAVLLAVMGADPWRAARLAELWLALAATVSSVATAQAYGSRPMFMQLALSLGIVATAEAIKQYAALPCALFVSAWQIRRGARVNG